MYLKFFKKQCIYFIKITTYCLYNNIVIFFCNLLRDFSKLDLNVRISKSINFSKQPNKHSLLNIIGQFCKMSCTVGIFCASLKYAGVAKQSHINDFAVSNSDFCNFLWCIDINFFYSPHRQSFLQKYPVANGHRSQTAHLNVSILLMVRPSH